jgi:hypothetical protein
MDGWNIVPPEIILVGTLNRMILPFQIIHGKTHGESLFIVRTCHGAGVEFAGLLPGFRSGNILGLGQRQQITQLRGVQKHLGPYVAMLS